MTRNLLRSTCEYCDHDIALSEPPRKITRDDAGIYYLEHRHLIVADAYCPVCDAKYLAWLELSHEIPGNYNIVDLSFLSTFNDEPGDKDLPAFVVEKKTVWVIVGKYCAYCKQPFDTTHPNVKYCSDDCRRKRNNQHHRDQYRAKTILWNKCEACGKTFKGTKSSQRYCCRSHQLSHYKKNNKHTKPRKGHRYCRECNEEFKVKTGHHIFCQASCRSKYGRKVRKTHDDVIDKCVECNEIFTKARINQRFCSRRCNLRYHNKKNYAKNKNV